ncbi:MAG: FAD-dependent oxidoreductase [Bdellovibrionaceae bacterium]|nr:FAD-dependent oxidoreductase [Pseudobdellovibrionaceae bacterium]
MKTADVIIIGAGAAGLACAKVLKENGKKIVILEARKRVGGRAFSFDFPTFSQPIEFGAEFIHGAPPVLLQLFEQQRMDFNDVSDRHLYFSIGKMKQETDFWERLQKVTDRLNAQRKKDRSVREFLDAQKNKIPKELRDIFTAYVEGFQAADLEKMGEKALAKTEQDEEGNLNGAQLFRPNDGYSVFFREFISTNQLSSNIHLQTLVRHVQWKNNSVMIHALEKGRKTSYSAKRVVITVPLGVLKDKNPTSMIEFLPSIPEIHEDLQNLHMGHVQRISFHFKTRFWEKNKKEPIGFMHAGPGNLFPAWWTQMPVRSPVLIAWQGGPKAEELGQRPVGERVDCALETLAKMTGHTKQFLKNQLIAYYTHNWSQDPYAMGAYSYTGLDIGKKPKLNIKNTLFFAGESFAEASEQGTVHGALRTGYDAANKILKIKT